MIEALLINLLAQAIWELGQSPVFRGSEASAEGEEDPQETKRMRASRYGQAARRAVQHLDSVDGLAQKEGELVAFLESAPVRSLLLSLYVFSFDSNATRGPEQAEEEFLALWERSNLASVGSTAGKETFGALLHAAEETLSTAVREGVLSAHESRSNARHQILLQRLDALERRLELTASGKAVDLDEVRRFEREFRREVHHRHAHISPPDFYSAARVDIDRLYVMPHLERQSRQAPYASPPIAIEEWIANFKNAVVLGDPGGGKSTLATKLCHVLADDSSGWVVSGVPRTPAMVTLREYSALNKEKGLSVAGYIEHVAETRYQLDIPDGAVDYLLLSGRLVVIFDGLDELLETYHRQQIRDNVESFQRRFPDTPILVTSRSVGYEQAPLDLNVFETTRLAQFSDEQVAEYASKWFSFDEDLAPDEQAQKASAFVEESRSVPDLRVNPLMLALMCNFYRGQNYLPRHRPEVYEQCARMLFETWDRSRGIQPVLPIAEHIRPAMRYLAYWIYQDEDRQGGAPEGALVEKAVEFLMEYRFEDEYEARHAAKAFIEFCAGRAWVFTDTGTTQEGEPLFQFTHRTFLEYFTADHLVATADSTQELSQLLRPRIAAREWVVVAQVAYQLRSKGTLSASDQLLRDLVDHSTSGSLNENANILLFASECLTFLVPSPPVVRSVSSRVLEFALEVFSQEIPDEASPIVGELIPTLANASPETRRTVGAVVEEVLSDRIASGMPEALTAALAIQSLGAGIGLTPEVFVEWQEITNRLRAETQDRRKQLAKESQALALSMANKGELSLSGLVEAHGTNCLFIGWPVPLHPGSFYGPLADNMLVFMSRSQEGELSTVATKFLSELAEVLPNHQPPWRNVSVGMHFGFPPFARLEAVGETEMSREVLRGAALVLAVKVEEQVAESGENGAGMRRLRELLEVEGSSLLEPLQPLLMQRVNEATDGEASVHNLGFSPDAEALLIQWMNGECDFVEGAFPAEGPEIAE